MGHLVLMQATYLKISKNEVNYYISSYLRTLIWAPHIAGVPRTPSCGGPRQDQALQEGLKAIQWKALVLDIQ